MHATPNEATSMCPVAGFVKHRRPATIYPAIPGRVPPITAQKRGRRELPSDDSPFPPIEEAGVRFSVPSPPIIASASVAIGQEGLRSAVMIGVVLTLLAGSIILVLVATAWFAWARSQGRSTLAEDWGVLLDRADVLILDTETTGLKNRDEVVEVALVDTRGEVRLARPIMPIGRISRQAAEIHGLTRKLLKELGAKPWPHVVPEYEALVCGAHSVLVWNAEFDARLISQTVQKHIEKGTVWLDMSGPDFAEVSARCLMTDYAAVLGRERISLLEAANLEGVKPTEPPHRAASDALTALALMRAFVARTDPAIRR